MYLFSYKMPELFHLGQCAGTNGLALLAWEQGRELPPVILI
jgi:hypothetical protein